MDASCGLTRSEVTAAFANSGWAEKFPPVMTLEETAALLQVSRHTIYDWNSRGLLKGCVRRVGKHLRFLRDRLLLHLFNEGLYGT